MGLLGGTMILLVILVSLLVLTFIFKEQLGFEKYLQSFVNKVDPRNNLI